MIKPALITRLANARIPSHPLSSCLGLQIIPAGTAQNQSLAARRNIGEESRIRGGVPSWRAWSTTFESPEAGSGRTKIHNVQLPHRTSLGRACLLAPISSLPSIFLFLFRRAKG